VVVNTRRRAEKLAETVTRITDADENTWKRLVQTAVNQFGKVTTLVHNAVHSYTKPAIEFSQEEWNEGLAVTLGGPWLRAKYCIPEMIRTGSGVIVYISTVNATITNPGFGLYGAAKGGLNALTRSIASTTDGKAFVLM
jgi:NAD(P)-dependent dehydrogenase (short-subunit alcohol dehydrogenase family)